MVDNEFLILTVTNSISSFVANTANYLEEEKWKEVKSNLDYYFQSGDRDEKVIAKKITGILLALYTEICGRFTGATFLLTQGQEDVIAFAVALGMEKAKLSLQSLFSIPKPTQMIEVELRDKKSFTDMLLEAVDTCRQEKLETLFDLWTVYNLYLASELNHEISYVSFYRSFCKLFLQNENEEDEYEL